MINPVMKKLHNSIGFTNFTFLQQPPTLMKIILYYTSICCFLFTCLSMSAQRDTPFTAEQKLYAKGNSVLIGNTILGKHPKLTFDEIKILNDQVPLNFVDIDEDENTFSSSSASFTLPETAKKVKYAGLYWGGLYPAKSSSKSKGKRRIKYNYTGEREARVQEVKLKINKSEYLDVKGQIIYDSEAKGPFAKESPYACFADVTPQLVGKKGEVLVTVANIRATTGFIEGGAAAGWLLYIVYEDDTETAKYFTSYSGFKEVSKEVVEVVFEGLQPKNENASSSKIMMAALEGDTKIKGDACAIFSVIKGEFISLTTEGRPQNNFFNSTVSVGYDVPMTRTPASKNTLGFDLIKMNVPDSTITANTTDAIIRLSTKQDRFYTFFLAFETEIEELVLEAQMVAADVVVGTSKTTERILAPPIITKQEVTISEPPPVFINIDSQEIENSKTENQKPIKKVEDVKTSKIVDAPIILKKTVVVIDDEEILKAALRHIESRKAVLSDEMNAGYYLVTNVFKNRTNAANWKNRLEKEGYNSRTFINKKNKMTYVYIESSKSPKEMQLRKMIVRQIPHLSKTWVCRVNL